MKTDTHHAIRLRDYTPSPFLVDHVDLFVRLDGAQTKVHGRYTVRPNQTVQHKEPRAELRLDADGLGALTLSVDGKSVEPRREATSVCLDVPTDSDSTIDVHTTLDPAANAALSGLYLTNSVYCTQCEAEGFRRIIPFLDRPDVLATYRVHLTARQSDCPVLLSNGNPGSLQATDDGWHSIVWDDPHPKPSYLFALVGGTLDKVDDVFTTADGRDVTLNIYVEPGKADRAGFAMEALKRSMAWDEQRFGRLYDLDVFNIVAVSDFNLGAMENKGLNIFNDKYILASPQTASDEDYERIEAIIAHEYFHNWSGNRITCRDWFQLCLKEGLTVYRDQEYTSDTYDRAIKRIGDVRTLWTHQFPEDDGPLAHPVRPDTYREINNFYTATVYEKGAEIVRMIASWLGRDRFRKAMDRYFETHDGQAVRMEDFLACMEAESGDLGDWPDFLSWYTQAGTPKVHVDVTRQDGSITLTFAQKTDPTPGQTDKQALPLPCRLGLVDTTGQDLDLASCTVTTQGGRWHDGLFLLENATGSLTLSGLPSGALQPSLFRDFSAPVQQTVTGLSDHDHLFLAAKDGNGFNSWAQFQALYSQALQRRYHHLQLEEGHGDDSALFAAIVEKVLGGDFTHCDDAAIRAATLTLPSSHDLARTLGKDVNPDIVDEARSGFSKALCLAHGEQFMTALSQLGIEDDGVIAPASAAKRSFVLALLHHLSHWDDERAKALLVDAHMASVGMTMRVKTLGLLVRSGAPQAQAALTNFAEHFGHDPLTMDKWFTVQATATGHAALRQCEELEQHPAFSWRNPNRVRALVGAFAMGNLTAFHAADGSGYRYLASRIAKIDRDNPQLAARLASAFRTWKTFAQPQRNESQAALNTLLATEDLSIDVTDIVTRTLDIA